MSGHRVRHVVLVKFKPETTDAQRVEFIRRSGWSRTHSFVTNYTSGAKVVPNPYAASNTDEWDWAMTLDFDEDDVLTYRDHPEHRLVGPTVGAYAERYAILDFVID